MEYKKQKLSISLLLIVFFSILLFLIQSLYTSTPDRTYYNINRASVIFSVPSHPILDVELAITPAEHARGLMNREGLPEREGMLFIFDEDAERSFWMKNTLIPLDMIFINSSFKIVNIIKYVQPCVSSSHNCPIYHSSGPARYVIEANAGFTDNYGIEVGQNVDILYY